MPNAKVLGEKQAIVAALSQRLKSSQSGLFIDYKGITVAEDNELRTQLRQSGIEYTVIKNTLCRRAIDEVGLSEVDPVLNGTTSLATTEGDPIIPFRVINDYAKKMGADKFNLKAAYLEGKVLNESEIAELSALSSKDALYSVVLGTMLAPITYLAVVLGQIAEQKGAPPAGSAPADEPAADESAAAATAAE
ncbi:MAG: 50S ribosomal protein L10 [Oscillospiraceae bacterium]|jgi:large subunit ribosomal protein L10|nr:50S ribosomal protein L10 [Oscillospiraceae bacterium]